MKRKLKWYSIRIKPLIIVITIIFLFFYIKYYRPPGNGKAGPYVNPDLFSTVWDSGEIFLLGMGDSITNGYGASKGNNYFELLVNNLDEKYPEMKNCDLNTVFPKLRYRNIADNCTVSKDHLDFQAPYITKHTQFPKGIVVMSSGGNDLLHDYGWSEPADGKMYGASFEEGKNYIKNYKNRINRILYITNKSFPEGCEIFFINVYDPTDGVGDIEKAHILLPKWKDGLKLLDLMNKTIKQICDENQNVHLIDIHKLFLGHGIHCRDKSNINYDPKDPHYWYLKNIEDPNNRGYDAIRRLVLNEMEKVYNK